MLDALEHAQLEYLRRIDRHLPDYWNAAQQDARVR
jgi:hypothetical protein